MTSTLPRYVCLPANKSAVIGSSLPRLACFKNSLLISMSQEILSNCTAHMKQWLKYLPENVHWTFAGSFLLGLCQGCPVFSWLANHVGFLKITVEGWIEKVKRLLWVVQSRLNDSLELGENYFWDSWEYPLHYAEMVSSRWRRFCYDWCLSFEDRS